ncbi:hypothetical protein WJX72_000023 [[Myrmecia] bisecta]|uniref:PsbP C-terminal domain-containing protein n=1 Tax=[Myrmecia] bisecta TaxID=41462 RepID=A0AAW1PRV3_9CHLO
MTGAERWEQRGHKPCQPGNSRSSTVCAAVSTKRRRKGDAEEPDKEAGPSRREIILQSVNFAVLGELISGTDDATTIVNSMLGAYGLPQLKGSKEFKLFNDLDNEYVFEYPRAWVARSNRQRDGIYISDFNTADKAALEIFPAPAEGSTEALVAEVVQRLTAPGQDVGGNSRLELPSMQRVKTETKMLGDQAYTYITFPSNTTTRSGYEIRRKNFAVAAAKRGMVYSLVASARSDQYNDEKAKMMRRIIDSFRLRQ